MLVGLPNIPPCTPFSPETPAPCHPRPPGPPRPPPHLQLELYPLEHVHVIHPHQQAAPLKLRQQLPPPPAELRPPEAVQQAPGVDACWGGRKG